MDYDNNLKWDKGLMWRHNKRKKKIWRNCQCCEKGHRLLAEGNLALGLLVIKYLSIQPKALIPYKIVQKSCGIKSVLAGFVPD